MPAAATAKRASGSNKAKLFERAADPWY
eukprot:SAG31_NODE_43086_length_268_cov_1.224852_1_plen_27_part_10